MVATPLQTTTPEVSHVTPMPVVSPEPQAAAPARRPEPKLIARTGVPCRASFYGDESGTITASGARNDPSAMHAAHRTLRFGTRVRLTRAGVSIVVTIDDRGPHVAGRDYDLSTTAFARLARLSDGVLTAHCEVLP